MTDVECDVIGKEGDIFGFHATHLVTAVVTELVSYIFHQTGSTWICLFWGGLFVSLHFRRAHVVLYHLSNPKKDVHADNRLRLHRAAIGQVLVFTLRWGPLKQHRKNGSTVRVKNCRPGRLITWMRSGNSTNPVEETRRLSSTDHHCGMAYGRRGCSNIHDHGSRMNIPSLPHPSSSGISK